MSENDLRKSVLVWGSVGACVGVLTVAVAVLQSFPLLLLGMLLFGVPLMMVPLIFGVTDTRMDTAAGATRIGFDAGDPNEYEAGPVLPIPNSVQIACWLSGVGVVGLVVLAVAA